MAVKHLLSDAPSHLSCHALGAIARLHPDKRPSMCALAKIPLPASIGSAPCIAYCPQATACCTSTCLCRDDLVFAL
jgi:hypothetical protein